MTEGGGGGSHTVQSPADHWTDNTNRLSETNLYLHSLSLSCPPCCFQYYQLPPSHKMLSTDGITNSNSDDDNYNFEEISQSHFLSILEIVLVFEELRRGGCFTGSIRYWNIAVVVGDSIYPGGGRGGRWELVTSV